MESLVLVLSVGAFFFYNTSLLPSTASVASSIPSSYRMSQPCYHLLSSEVATGPGSMFTHVDPGRIHLPLPSQPSSDAPSTISHMSAEIMIASVASRLICSSGIHPEVPSMPWPMCWSTTRKRLCLPCALATGPAAGIPVHLVEAAQLTHTLSNRVAPLISCRDRQVSVMLEQHV